MKTEKTQKSILILSLILAIIMIVASMPIVIIASATTEINASDQMISIKDSYDLTALYSYCKLLGFETADMNVKKAKDPSGVPYIICEGASNDSYLIYNLEEEAVTEYSLNAKSPYFNKNENLVYGGPSYYLEQKHNTYVSIFDSQLAYEIDKANQEKIYCADADISIITSTLKTSSVDSITTYADVPWVENVKHPEFFYDECKYNCGYFSGGYCGFIGLGMLIGYTDKYKDDRVMDNKFYASTGLKNYSDGIGAYLYSLKPKESTTAVHITLTMDQYVKVTNIKINGHWAITPFFSNEQIYRAIKNDMPVELFGRFNYETTSGTQINTGNHAIVCYGSTQLYLGGGTLSFFRCNMG